MKIFITDNATGSRLWRLDPYQKWLERNGHNVIRHPQEKQINAVEGEWSDIAIVQMVLEKKVIDLFHKFHTPVIYEIDDLIEKVTKNHPSHHKLTKFTTVRRTYNCIRKADALFCSTKPIYDRYGWLKGKKDKYIFPNLLDLDYWEKPHQKNTADEIRVGWAGSWAHKDDLRFISPILKKIVDKYPKVKLVYAGMGGVYAKDSFNKFRHSEDLFPEIPPERREFHAGVGADEWASKLASMRLDIGIAPVVDNKFSRAKSNIKWQEYAINRIVGVFSDVLYKDTVDSGKDGFVVGNTEEEWIDKLSFFIENKAVREKMAERAYERAKSRFNIEQQYEEWFRTVQDIHSRYVARTGGKQSLPSGTQSKTGA